MYMMRKISILVLLMAAACQPTSSTVPITVLNVPASDDIEDLDLSKLADGFPILAEMILPTTPKSCGLSKATRVGLDADASDKIYDSRYVFSFQGIDGATDEPLYQVGINGVVRTVKESGSADKGAKKVRYYKTVDAPEIEVLVAIEPGESDAGFTGTVGRIKAWDDGAPLMCGYNIIKVAGDCDL